MQARTVFTCELYVLLKSKFDQCDHLLTARSSPPLHIHANTEHVTLQFLPLNKTHHSLSHGIKQSPLNLINVSLYLQPSRVLVMQPARSL